MIKWRRAGQGGGCQELIRISLLGKLLEKTFLNSYAKPPCFLFFFSFQFLTTLLFGVWILDLLQFLYPHKPHLFHHLQSTLFPTTLLAVVCMACVAMARGLHALTPILVPFGISDGYLSLLLWLPTCGALLPQIRFQILF